MAVNLLHLHFCCLSPEGMKNSSLLHDPNLHDKYLNYLKVIYMRLQYFLVILILSESDDDDFL